MLRRISTLLMLGLALLLGIASAQAAGKTSLT